MTKRVAAAALNTPGLPRLALPPVALTGGADKRAADALARVLAAYIIRGSSFVANLVSPMAGKTVTLKGDDQGRVISNNGD
ncbi:MAG: hypothetical protein LBB83_09340 [Treponema sp.]|jgi:hypothetical protein|nr:hypothetical protein [Treponema sp.]